MYGLMVTTIHTEHSYRVITGQVLIVHFRITILPGAILTLIQDVKDINDVRHLGGAIKIVRIKFVKPKQKSHRRWCLWQENLEHKQ